MLALEQEWVNTALGAGALLGGIGYALGQFISSRRRGVADSLKTALDEIEAERLAKERLAKVAIDRADDLAAARLENATLRSALSTQGGRELADDIIRRVEQSLSEIKKVVHEEHEKTRELVRKAVKP